MESLRSADDDVRTMNFITKAPKLQFEQPAKKEVRIKVKENLRGF